MKGGKSLDEMEDVYRKRSYGGESIGFSYKPGVAVVGGTLWREKHRKVALDIRRGLVSGEGACCHGVVLNSNRSVDESDTNDLRRRMVSERGDIGLFNFGGTVEELKACWCKADPPVTPVF
jgi:hypothetical protein